MPRANTSPSKRCVGASRDNFWSFPFHESSIFSFWPAQVENVYGLCPLGQQVFVYGDSLRNHLILFVVPDPAAFAPFASKVLDRKVKPEMEAVIEAAKEPTLAKAVLAEYAKVGKAQKLNGFVLAVSRLLYFFVMGRD